jgi:hypothetical protein
MEEEEVDFIRWVFLDMMSGMEGEKGRWSCGGFSADGRESARHKRI